jgi:hypothetical protein
MVASRLYAKVDVEVPQDRAISWTTGGYLMFRPHIIQSLRELTVRNGLIDHKSEVYNRERKSDAGSVDAYVQHVVEHVPQDQLSSFAYADLKQERGLRMAD